VSRSCEVEAIGSAAIVVRRGTGAADAAHVRAVGERLAAAAHPGVVEVVSSTGTDDLWELQLVHAGRPVSLVGPLSVEQVGGVAAAVAATLADLHAAGVVHGSIDGSHVLIGPHGRPALCGFDPAAGPAARPEDDIAALGALIVELLGTDAEVEPIPERRWRRGAARTGWTRRSLLLVADQACAEPPTRRPSARRLAAAIADAVPGAQVPDAPAPITAADPLDSLRPRSEDEQPHARLPGAICALLGVVALGAGAWRVAQPMRAAEAVRSAPASMQPTTTRPPITVEGTSVAMGGRHFEIGQPGDLVVVGDWDGDGEPTAAVLRPPTGEVFVFRSWTTGDDVVVRAVATVEAAVELLVDRVGDHDQLVVRAADGSRHQILSGAPA
jgi:hypothetical protein